MMITRNRKAGRDFEVSSRIEAGIELKGSEIKSLRLGKVNLSDSYAIVDRGQVFLKNLHISHFSMATGEPLDPIRPRRLLLHKREIAKLAIKTQQRGMSLIPTAIYFKGSRVKIELGLGLGRKKFDKRQAIAKAESDRRIRQATKKRVDR